MFRNCDIAGCENQTGDMVTPPNRASSVYGASPDRRAWFLSYLEERRKFVKLGQQPKPIRQGVPGGSILGPVLFLLFVNVMPLHLNNSTIDVYADDTTLSLSANWNNIT